MGSEIQRVDLFIEARIRPAAFGVELDDVVERGKAAIVHIGSGASKISKCWRLKRTAITLDFGYGKAAVIGEFIVTPRDSSIVE